jgi:hydrogenase maturation protein HypF
MLGGDSSVKDGWKSAFSYIYHCREQEERLGMLRSLGEPQDSRWPTVKAGLAHGVNCIKSSSMGRLFDAVAAFAGIHEENRYEGECAIMLENAAAAALEAGLAPWDTAFEIREHGGGDGGLRGGAERGEQAILVSALPIFRDMEAARTAGVDRGRVALGFHYAAADMILRVCDLIRSREGIETVALSGGVFQNKLLTERVLALLRAVGFRPYCNRAVSPNDGGICLGQSYIGMKYLTGKRDNGKIE